MADTSDYVGCFEKATGSYSRTYIFSSTMTRCKCVGYCNSLNYSMAANGYYG